ncbi:Hypothetical protein BN2458_PEG1747 [Helicobacter typhlonius]|uniref:Uncharacterized protein n=1 Tax=Helicobacter typhlonius TaxID=76936 RepID=A0A0S4PXY6_9HELI|nr:Hypothetical protein BN2458_PEG1747 [Helicobacter typhlonius]
MIIALFFCLNSFLFWSFSSAFRNARHLSKQYLFVWFCHTKYVGNFDFTQNYLTD